MKKLIQLSIALFSVACFLSCKKDWNCDCTVQENTTTTIMTNMKKKDAEKSCEDLSSLMDSVNGSCELK
jgi:hypothetical protein